MKKKFHPVLSTIVPSLMGNCTLFNHRLYPLQSPTVPSLITNCTLFNRRLYPVGLALVAVFLPALGFSNPTSSAAPWNTIDQFIAKSLKEKGVMANPPISDEVFLKRIYLEIAGRLPTVMEARVFLDSKSQQKRNVLIDQLLDSEDFAYNFFNYWADILRVRVKRESSGGGYAEFANWLMDALLENRPYDQMVREIVTAEGLVAKNGAAVYTKRDFSMPLDNMASTVRVFLGVRLECAQCHDDPFDDWTQQDFYKMAAYSYGFKHRSSRGDGSLSKVRAMIRKNFFDPKIKDRSGEFNMLDRTWLAVASPWAGHHATGTSFQGPRLKLPHDYQYDDAKPNTPVKPATIFGDIPELGDPKQRIHRYAEWMTSPENPTFTKLIVNRLWERTFGVRLHAYSPTERVDDFSLDSKSLHPELFKFLCDQMKAANYDLRVFLGMLYKSRIYQRAANTEDTPPYLGEYLFRGPTLKRASAEQIWDSLVGLINPRPNHGNWVNRVRLDVRLKTLNEYHAALSQWDEEKFYQAILKIRESMKANQAVLDKKIAEIRANHKGTQAELAKKLAALKKGGGSGGGNQGGFTYQYVYNPALAAAGPRARFSVRLPGDLGELPIRDEWKTIRSKPVDAFLNQLAEISKKIIAEEYEQYGISRREDQIAYRRYRSSATKVNRSADIDLPAPPGHFLRKFGQADRRLIENSTREASLIQPLALMNERTIDLLRSPYSPLSLTLAKTEKLEDKIETIYLSLLARKPTTDERRILTAEARARGKGFEEDLVAALLNTGEFLFIR